ncbi:hypothetical protein [Lysobacter sp. D1-1-M9]|uniref:hypothetical protein n=1 Tax=Novilysobacter longmucuonensis TaxID=3098603 RepID=UPI003983775B
MQRHLVRLLPYQHEAIAQELVEVVVVVVADLQHLLELRSHQRLDLVDVHPLAPVGEAAQVAEQGDDVDAPAGDGAAAFGERGVEVLDVH